MPNARRYLPGFLRRSLSFAVPAGVIVGLTITAYALAAKSLGTPIDALRTGATVLLAVMGIRILSALCRPLNRYKGAVVGAMFLGLVVVFAIPLSRQFFELVDPGVDTAIVMALLGLLAIVLIEAVRVLHRRFVARALAAGGSAAVATHPSAPQRPVTVSTAVVLVYLGGIASAMFGLLFLLVRYEVDRSESLAVTYAGIAIMLFGLLAMAAARGLSLGSGLSRVFVTVLAGLLIAVQVWSVVIDDDWATWTLAQIVAYAFIVVALWTPPGLRFFRPVLQAGR